MQDERTEQAYGASDTLAMGSDDDALGDDAVTDDGDHMPDDVQAELEAIAAADREASDALEQALVEARQEADRSREQTQTVLARYREAVLGSEPDLPPELVRGETLEALEASIAAAREVVARVRERMQGGPSVAGFPVGAPGRDALRAAPRTAAEKIARGLEDAR